MLGLKLSVLATLALVAGCARVATTTTVNPDGSMLRVSEYVVPATPNPAAGDPPTADLPAQQPESFFKLPKDGNGVAVERRKDPNAVTVRVTRKVPAGKVLEPDVVVLAAAGGEPLLVSSVRTSVLSDGRIEYVEKLHWTGPKTDTAMKIDPDLRLKVKQSLPMEFRETKTIDAIGLAVGIDFAQTMFGPPEPLIGAMMFDPDGAGKRMRSQLFNKVADSFQRSATGMTQEQAKDSARKFVAALALNQNSMQRLGTSPGTRDPDPKSTESSVGEMVTLHFAVRLPGVVLESNGLTDSFDGTVYWSLMGVAASMRDVELRAVSRP